MPIAKRARAKGHYGAKTTNLYTVALDVRSVADDVQAAASAIESGRLRQDKLIAARNDLVRLANTLTREILAMGSSEGAGWSPDRHIRQFEFDHEEKTHELQVGGTLYALCDDGTMWRRTWVEGPDYATASHPGQRREALVPKWEEIDINDIQGG